MPFVNADLDADLDDDLGDDLGDDLDLDLGDDRDENLEHVWFWKFKARPVEECHA